MWTQVDVHDVAGLDRHVSIMQQMDRGYAELNTAELVAAIHQERAEVWHYQGAGFEIAMMFRYISPRAQWHIANLGFVGNLQPPAALDLAVDRLRDFYQAHAATNAIAVRTKAADYQPLKQLHDLVPTHPRLHVTETGTTETTIVWEIEYVGPAGIEEATSKSKALR